MMKLLAGIEPLTAGQRIVGDGVCVGYFAQNLAETLDYDLTVLEELARSAGAMTDRELRGLLGALLFSGDDVLKPVRVLSGGERARIALAKVLARRNNCLLLDEPTNNLDIIAKDTLLEALRRFPGTVLIVSHDRHVLNELVTEVFEVGQGHAIRYLGNYDDYLHKKAQEEGTAARPARQERETPPRNFARNGPELRIQDRDEKRRRERDAKRRAEIEAQIEIHESERARLSIACPLSSTDYEVTAEAVRKNADATWLRVS